jgi:Protein of unknown function (DUF3309)
MSLGLILIIILVLFLIGVLPAWPLSRRWAVLSERRIRTRPNYRPRAVAPWEDLGD